MTEVRPNDRNSCVNLPLVEISLRHFEDAEHHLKKAVAVDAESIQAYTDLANFYRLQGRRLEAEQVLQDAIAKNPDGTAHNMVWEGFARSAAENMHNKVIAESGV